MTIYRCTRPAPADRYPHDGSRQAAVEIGFQQMYDHDSFAFLDRMRSATDFIDDPVRRAETMAAALLAVWFASDSMSLLPV
ncbi:MAG: hypothetical protein ACREEO_00635 [Phenylobacterium sp.]